MRLCFGQNVLPYKNGKTTSIQVARWLENKYHLKEVFYWKNKKEIGAIYKQAIQDAQNDAIHGVFKAKDLNILFGKANKQVTQMFRNALNKQAFDGIVGVPTLRAQLGISSRFKYGYVTKKNKNGTFRVVKLRREGAKGKVIKAYSRPSFIDTQLYCNSSEIWIKE